MPSQFPQFLRTGLAFPAEEEVRPDSKSLGLMPICRNSTELSKIILYLFIALPINAKSG